MTPDVVVVGAGSGGCAAAARLAEAGLKTLVLEAGPTDAHPLVRVPFGLVWLMGSRRDWAYRSTPQAALDGRSVSVPRGKTLGGSGSINSMVWFRGRADDYAAWDLPEWSAEAVADAFDAVEDRVLPGPLPAPHPLSRAFADALPGPLTPEAEGAGVFRVNMRKGRRHSAADAFLRPAMRTGNLEVRTGRAVDRLEIAEGRARAVILDDGTRIAPAGGVVLAAGAIATPAILLRSGMGPGPHLREMGIEVVLRRPRIGRNLHDHPAVAVHHAGRGSGYGLTLAQLPAWALAPVGYLSRGRGRWTSNTVEAGAFLTLSPDDAAPRAQVHFIPAKLGWAGRAITWGAGYYADICLCQPRSRGTLRLASPDPGAAPEIDLALLSEPEDMDDMRAAFARLRHLLAEAPFGRRRAAEAYPGPDVADDDQVAAHIRARCGTAYHPVGTVAMGGPLDGRAKATGLENLWVADASIMPRITSANTNAPSMMIGYRVGGFVAEDLK